VTGPTSDVVAYDAVVPSGGRARRLGGESKPELVIGGEALIVTALRAAAGARITVVGGPPTPHHPAEFTVREEPPGGGPVAAIAAGVAALAESEWVLVLACDAPGAAAGVPALVAAAATASADAVVGIDDGERQPLLSLYRGSSLRRALAAISVESASMRALLEQLVIDEVPLPEGAAHDIDTWEDVENARRELT
jgi:molybdopterin-guanine dinucleotide biosynthesis protein A